MKCDADIRKELHKNILLAGGNTMFPGLAVRLKKEMWPLVAKGTKLKIISRAERKYYSWIGGLCDYF